MRRHVVRLGPAAAVALAAAWAIGAGAVPAAAHAALESSDPGDGAMLGSAPSSITLTYSEPPDPDLSQIRVLDTTGAELEVSEPRARGPSLEARLPQGSGDGVYTVSWRVVSAVDGHLTAGAFTFGVGVDPAGSRVPGSATQDPSPAPNPVTVSGRSLLYAGIALLVGAALTGRLAFAGHVPGRAAVLLGGSVALMLGAVLMLLGQAISVGVGIVTLLGSAAGRASGFLVAVAILTSAAGVAASHGSERALTVAGVGAAAAALVRSIGGHAAAAPTPPLQVALQTAHVLAVSSWIGGLVLLALRARSRGGDLARDARRFSSLAVVAAPVAVATGVLRASDELGGPAWFLRAFETSYGTTLVVKVAIVVILLASGWWNRTRGIARLAGHGDRAGPSSLRGVVMAEVGLAVAVFGLTGTFTGFPPRPSADQQRPAAPPAATARGTDLAGTVEVVLRAEPGTAGPNRFMVRLLDPLSGAPVDADTVTLRLEPIGAASVPPSEIDLERHGDHWAADGSNLSLPGTWQVRATIVRGARGLEVPLVLTTRPPPAEVSSTASPGLPSLTTWTLADGTSLQTYLDPEDPGLSQAHLTAFDPSGVELALDTTTFVAFPPGGEPDVLPSGRFGEGHFVATVELTPGRWRFAITATAADGRILQTSLSRRIGPG